ncbi:MAG: glycosyltransferase family 4 protein [Cyanobacteria bacterium P01_D01_bin.156]
MSTWRSLVIVQVPPYPPTGGVALRNWQTLNLLKRQGDVTIFSVYKGSSTAAALAEKGFQLSHYDIASPNRPWHEKIKNRLGPLRPDGYYYSDWLYTAAASKQLRQLLHTYQPTLIVFEELWLYPYLPVVKNYPCPIILDNHNIEGSKEDYRLQPYKLKQIRHIEKKFVRQVDQTWVCSTVDAQQLQQLYGVSNTVKIIANGVQANFYQPTTQQNRDNHQILFLGKFSYQPNEEAALIAINEIYPTLKKYYSDSQLWLVGRDPTPAMTTAANSDQDIHITGMVADVRPYLQTASVMIVPLRQGGGTRLKIIEAFASHCPVVSTTKGAEGLQAKDNYHLCIGNSPKQIVDQVMHLWQNQPSAQQMAAQAYELFMQNYSWQAVAKSTAAALATLSRVCC